MLREWAAEKCKKQRIEDQNKKKTKRTKRIGAKERPTYHDNNENKRKKKNGGGEGGGGGGGGGLQTKKKKVKQIQSEEENLEKK